MVDTKNKMTEEEIEFGPQVTSLAIWRFVKKT